MDGISGPNFESDYVQKMLMIDDDKFEFFFPHSMEKMKDKKVFLTY